MNTFPFYAQWNFISVSDAIMHYEPYLNLKKQMLREISLLTGKNPGIEGGRLPGCRGVSLQTEKNPGIEGGRPLPFIIFTEKE